MRRTQSRGRWLLVGSVSATAILGLVLAAWFSRWVGQPWNGKVYEREHQVSLVLPSGWTDETAADAGRVVTVDDSGDEAEPHRLPDIVVGASGEDEDVPAGFVRVEVLPAAGKTLERLHAEHVATACTDLVVPCNHRRSAEQVLVDQHLAIAEFLTSATALSLTSWAVPASETVWVVTVDDGARVVRFSGESKDRAT